MQGGHNKALCASAAIESHVLSLAISLRVILRCDARCSTCERGFGLNTMHWEYLWNSVKIYTASQKNVPTLICYNLDIHG